MSYPGRSAACPQGLRVERSALIARQKSAAGVVVVGTSQVLWEEGARESPPYPDWVEKITARLLDVILQYDIIDPG